MTRQAHAPSSGHKNTRRTKDLCHDCPAKCCHDLVIAINKPRTRSDIDHYKWQLQYDTVRIAIYGNKWHTVYAGRCIYLDDDNLCTIYDRRPERCRRHNPPECEHYGTWYDTLIETPEELEAHIEAEKARQRAARKRRAKKKARATP